MTVQKTIELGASTLTLEVGEVARQAHGAVLVRDGDTVVLVTAVAEKQPRDDIDFFPLTVEYREKTASAGRIPGGFLRREGRITDHEVLTSRLIDRSVRPLFPKGYRCDVVLQAMVLSADPQTADPAMMALVGAAAALHISPIPWEGPALGARIAAVGSKVVVSPNPGQRAGADVELVVAARRGGIVMLEGAANEVDEGRLLEVLASADAVIEAGLAALDALRSEVGAEKWETPEAPVAEPDPIRAGILGGEGRPDGRATDEVRPITVRANWLPRPHGSALFTRGQTQAAVTCTVGGPKDEQAVETLAGMERKRFLLHYNFPPFSVGEVRSLRGPGRREVGHGALAARALTPLLPSPREYPYVLRVESDILESSGSSSMATVCGATIAMMDAGVPLKRAVAGIAMGLVSDGDQTIILSDILGDEDHVGDMDFKVAGTREGITALQLDNKLGNLPSGVLAAALEQAKAGRHHILDVMDSELASPREDTPFAAPKIVEVEISPDAVGLLIGPKGATIKGLQDEFKVTINVDDEGKVAIASSDEAAAKRCAAKIRGLVGVVEVGKLYEGRVLRVMDPGAVVKIYETADGWLHVSEWAEDRTERMGDVVSQGDNVIVRVQGVDGRGRLRLSRKDALDRRGEVIVNGG